jgi:hypothetical protein
MRFKKLHLLALLGLAVGMLTPGPAAASSSINIIASEFDSPRGITFVGDRAVVAESGHGSNSANDCFAPDPNNTSFKICVGNTSRISWVNTTSHKPTPLATGFFSISLGGEETIGVSGLSVRKGKLYAQIGANSIGLVDSFPIASQAGDLISVNPSNGSWQKISDVGDLDYDWTVKNFTPPDSTCGLCVGRQEHDSNPTAVLATENGWLVADSGSNTLTKISKSGKWSIVHYFPARAIGFPSDEVPTCVASGEDGLWVGTLLGNLFRVNGKNATQVVPRDSTGKALLSHVTGCTTGPDGSLYLVNMFGPGEFGTPTFFNGSVVRYDPEDGTASVLGDAVSSGGALALPYSASVGPDGKLYVTAGAVCPASGANPFPGMPNPCTVGDIKGGRVVTINLSHDDED